MRRGAHLLLLAVLGVCASGCFGGTERPAEGAPRSGGGVGMTGASVQTVHVEAGDLRTMPAVPDAALARLRADLGTWLADLYARGFLPPIAVRSSATPRPTPRPRPPVADLFTQEARATLEASRDAFAPGDGATVRAAVVRYGGVATIEDGRPTTALLSVELEANGRLDQSRMRLKQSGQLLCVLTPDGWRVAGFDLQLTSERLESPS